MTQLYGKHSGRVRLPNGRFMTLRAFRETTAELYPEPLLIKEDDDRIEQLETTVSNISRRLSGIEAMKRLREDTRKGNIGKPTRPLGAPASVPQFIPEI
jgi:hypothetical protein|tara:strand:+ start:794 stop:1090 length:297 start_codon:yes stop_codon:yes gene_type:complete